jgi:Reverse transcriptase (RNA-dependent DNA polymerase)
MPKNRRCVKCKWVFKIKRSGVYRARLVACGYSQIAGVDFSSNYAPVINDVTWRIMLIAMLKNLWSAKIIDVETAFLHGDLEEDIYMDCPPGLEDADNKTECLKLQTTIYGLVQSAQQFWKKLVKTLRDMGFEGGYPDPCMMKRTDERGTVFIALYVDDCLCIGDKKALDGLEKEFNDRHFSVTTENNLKDYLSCEITMLENRRSALLRQPHLLKNLRSKFYDSVKSLQSYKTPGTPHIGMIRPTDKDQIVDEEDHKRYQTGVGMLLYLVKHTRPDIANAVRELTKLNDGPTASAMKELNRVIKYVLDTEDLGLKISPDSDDMWSILAYSDSDFAGDKETRISVSGYVIFICNAIACWKSKGQRSVTLSSSEAEYVALSEAAKEVKFIWMILKSMGFEVKSPITVRVDNIGAIFMSENVTTSERTKHVDTRFRFVNEFVKDGFIEVIFVRTKENAADIFTKNTNTETAAPHHALMLSRE